MTPGRWLIDSWDRDRFDIATTFTLKQPELPKSEPRSPISDRADKKDGADGSSGAPGEVLTGYVTLRVQRLS